MSLIEFKNVNKSYKMGEVVITAVKDVNFSIEEGEVVIILGASGAGKTTVLNMLGGIDRVENGQIIVEGEDIVKYNEKELTNYRRSKVGFVFQFYNLIASLNALENVEFAADACKDALDSKTVLEEIGLGQRLNNFPSQLSGGEQQRVAIARAIAKNPLLLLCDEPTGALDYQTGKNVLKMLINMSEKYKKTLIIITHNNELTQIGDKIIKMRSGMIESVNVNENKKQVDEIEW